MALAHLHRGKGRVWCMQADKVSRWQGPLSPIKQRWGGALGFWCMCHSTLVASCHYSWSSLPQWTVTLCFASSIKDSLASSSYTSYLINNQVFFLHSGLDVILLLCWKKHIWLEWVKQVFGSPWATFLSCLYGRWYILTTTIQIIYNLYKQVDPSVLICGYGFRQCLKRLADRHKEAVCH